LRPTLPKKYSPLQPTGNGNQGVYLAELPDGMARVIVGLLDGQVEQIRDQVTAVVVEEDPDVEAVAEIEHRADIPDCWKRADGGNCG